MRPKFSLDRGASATSNRHTSGRGADCLHDREGRVGRNAALVALVARHEDVAGHAPAGAPRVAHRPVVGAGRGAVADN